MPKFGYRIAVFINKVVVRFFKSQRKLFVIEIKGINQLVGFFKRCRCFFLFRFYLLQRNLHLLFGRFRLHPQRLNLIKHRFHLPLY
ncbi:MAG: hypothetical protein R3D58_18670 [Saprospiraceae bacterium]